MVENSSLTAPERKSSRVRRLPKALKRRPKWRKSTIDHLEKNSPKDAMGNYLDARTFKPITGKRHVGHQKVSWREYQDNPANLGKTRKQVIDDYNEVKNLGFEAGSSNSSIGASTKGLENK